MEAGQLVSRNTSQRKPLKNINCINSSLYNGHVDEKLGRHRKTQVNQSLHIIICGTTATVCITILNLEA